jgi:hypothetical protein
MTEQPTQPPDEAELERRRAHRLRTAYRLAVSLVTARDDMDLKRQLIQDAADSMPQATYRDLLDVAKMYAASSLMLTGYVAGLANMAGDGVDERLRATIRVELLADE